MASGSPGTPPTPGRRHDEDEAADALGGLEAQPLGDHAAERVAEDVGAPDPELVEHPEREPGLGGDRQRHDHARRPGGARRIELDQPQPVEHVLDGLPHRGVRPQPVDEQHGRSSPTSRPRIRRLGFRIAADVA
jgi:hypothetical protein